MGLLLMLHVSFFFVVYFTLNWGALKPNKYNVFASIGFTIIFGALVIPIAMIFFDL